MCGILFNVSGQSDYEFDAQSLSDLSKRGPDASRTVRKISTGNSTWHLSFASSVLWLRGTDPCLQPLVDEETESVLCWNGEAWLFDNKQLPGNDTDYIFKALLQAASSALGSSRSIVDVLDKIKGPYAFVFYDGQSKRVFYGRDVLGRRSLLSSSDTNENVLTVSSLSTTKYTQQLEVDPNHIQILDLTKSKLSITQTSRNQSISRINDTTPFTDEQLMSCPSIGAVEGIISNLSVATQLRVRAIPSYTVPPHNSLSTIPSRVAILFSGGLDCTLLARLAHDVLPSSEPIDLLNVAFENPRVVRARAVVTKDPPSSSVDFYELCPDRQTGRSSYAELASVCSSRLWRFIAVNVPYTEYKSHSQIITSLMAPHNTEMDHSITTALYFAARGSGLATLSNDPLSSAQHYATTARVLLSGLGADELFAGYARHAAAFTRGGYPTLISELDLDISRIGTRNLGRDDRVISHWGRETRYPFLDENFVNYALAMPVWDKCGFRSEKRIRKHYEESEKVSCIEDLDPAKMVLRMALWQLGIKGAAQEKKRAIQFGTRSAKMELGRTKGTDTVTHT